MWVRTADYEIINFDKVQSFRLHGPNQRPTSPGWKQDEFVILAVLAANDAKPIASFKTEEEAQPIIDQLWAAVKNGSAYFDVPEVLKNR